MVRHVHSQTTKRRPTKVLSDMPSSKILNPDLLSSSRTKDCETIKDTYQEACNAKQKAKFTSLPNIGNNNYQSNNSNSHGGNNNNKRKKFTKNLYLGNCQHQTKDKSKIWVKRLKLLFKYCFLFHFLLQEQNSHFQVFLYWILS